jgi:GNAT superfamily N-acetyltransferase
VSIRIRRIETVDWAVAKELRLRALADAPEAFAATLADEAAFDDTRWQERARSNAQAVDTVGFFALDAGAECGLAIGVRSSADVSIVELNALWVAPQVRRRGAAHALVQAVEGWARIVGAEQLALEVTGTSHAAIALYKRMGFIPTAGGGVSCGARQAPAQRMSKRVR